MSLAVHFGLFNRVVAFWRRWGVDVRPLLREPLKAKSLAEFWSRRWNLAFSEMPTLGVYRPLERSAGKRAAIVAGFLFSGLLHELAISVPVGTGFGLPLLYFALHGGLVTMEGLLERRGHPVHGNAWLGRAWTLFWLVLPLPLLFHLPFLQGVVWQLLT